MRVLSLRRIYIKVASRSASDWGGHRFSFNVAPAPALSSPSSSLSPSSSSSLSSPSSSRERTERVDNDESARAIRRLIDNEELANVHALTHRGCPRSSPFSDEGSRRRTSPGDGNGTVSHDTHTHTYTGTAGSVSRFARPRGVV